MDPIQPDQVAGAAASASLAAVVALGFAWRLGRTTVVTNAASALAGVLVTEAVRDRIDARSWALLAVVIAPVLAAPLRALPFARPRPLQVRLVTFFGVASGFGVYVGVPETDFIAVVAGALGGIAAVALVLPVRTSPSAPGVVLSLSVAMAAAGEPASWLRLLGALLCLGLVLTWPVGQILRRAALGGERTRAGVVVGWWLVAAHLVLVSLAARWIAAAEDATAVRAVVVVALGVAVGALARPRERLSP